MMKESQKDVSIALSIIPTHGYWITQFGTKVCEFNKHFKSRCVIMGYIWGLWPLSKVYKILCTIFLGYIHIIFWKWSFQYHKFCPKKSLIWKLEWKLLFYPTTCSCGMLVTPLFGICIINVSYWYILFS